MSGKRRATNVLTRDNWDEEEEASDAGETVLNTASPDILQQRKIVRARRSLNTEGSPASGVFSGFKGFSNFGSNIQNAFTSAKRDVGEIPKNGLSTSTTNVSIKANQYTAQKDSEKRSNDPYHESLKNLNETFYNWIGDYMKKSKNYDFSPVCRDYQAHIEKLKKDYPCNDNKEKENEQENMSKLKPSIIPSTNFGQTQLPQTSNFGLETSNLFKIPVSSSLNSQNFLSSVTSLSETNNPEKERSAPEEDENYVPPRPEFSAVEEENSVYNTR